MTAATSPALQTYREIQMKKTTLNIILVTIGVLIAPPLSAYADGGNDPQRLAKLKEVKLQGLEGRLNVLQQEKSCVQAATTMDALHSCEQVSHQSMEQLMEKQKASWESLKASNQQGKENKK